MRIGRGNACNVTACDALVRTDEKEATGIESGTLNHRSRGPPSSATSTELGGLPDATGVLGVHWLSLVAAECLAELIEVLHRAVHAPAAR